MYSVKSSFKSPVFVALLLTGFIAGTSFTNAAIADTGDKGGNGGNGLVIRGKVYSLDLVEGGVEDGPVFDPSVPVRPGIEKRVLKNFDSSLYPVKQIAQKLTEVFENDPLLGTAILRTMEMYSWRQVHSSLIDSHDHETVLNYKPEDLRQLAIRKDQSIFIDKALWLQLDDGNRAGLVFHEAVYALARVTENSDEEMTRNSSYAREFVGYIFSSDLGRKDIENLYRIADNRFPTDHDTKNPVYKNGIILGKKSDTNQPLLVYRPLLAVDGAPYIDTGPYGLGGQRAVGKTTYYIARPGVPDYFTRGVQDICDGYKVRTAMFEKDKDGFYTIHLQLVVSSLDMQFGNSPNSYIQWSIQDHGPFMREGTTRDIRVQDETCASKITQTLTEMSPIAIRIFGPLDQP